jgi:hypothetical protein
MANEQSSLQPTARSQLTSQLANGGVISNQRRLQLKKVKPHELLEPPKVDLQKELIVS